ARLPVQSLVLHPRRTRADRTHARPSRGVDGDRAMRSRRRDYTRRNKIDGPFAPRLIEMLESPAYRALTTLSAHRVLARIELELPHHGGDDNGKLLVTYEHFIEYGIDKDAIAPAIRELAALGFIEVTEQGRGGAGGWHEPNQFRLTYRPVGNARPTHE